MNIKKSGKERTFKTGAIRDNCDEKPALELISPIFEERLGNWLQKGAIRYGPRNWEKGIPMEASLASLKRHIRSYQEGKIDEDHLSAAACNIMFLIHTEVMIKRGILPKELAYKPNYGEDVNTEEYFFKEPHEEILVEQDSKYITDYEEPIRYGNYNGIDEYPLEET